jgi:hypothetical protein
MRAPSGVFYLCVWLAPLCCVPCRVELPACHMRVPVACYGGWVAATVQESCASHVRAGTALNAAAGKK